MAKSKGKKVTKSELLAEIAEATGTDRKTAGQLFDSLTAIAYREASEKGEFTIPGIGKLVKQERKERMGRNPATGDQIMIPAKTVVKFRVARAATEAVS